MYGLCVPIDALGPVMDLGGIATDPGISSSGPDPLTQPTDGGGLGSDGGGGAGDAVGG
jgi:hypothetical protein